jgi:hypothetical protein
MLFFSISMLSIVKVIEVEKNANFCLCLILCQWSLACSIPGRFRFRICCAAAKHKIVLKLKEHCYVHFAEWKKHLELCSMVL